MVTTASRRERDRRPRVPRYNDSGLKGSVLIVAILLSFGFIPGLSLGPDGPSEFSRENSSAGPSNTQLGGGHPLGTGAVLQPASRATVPSLAEGAKAVRANGPLGCTNCNLYMQEGATIQQACFSGASGSCTGYAGFAGVYVDVTLESTPYPTGFELNGWSNTGDWYQSMILLNWCSTGFSVGNEAFDNGGTSVYPSAGGAGCYGNLSISSGDNIQLGLHVTQSGTGAGDVCFTASDLTTGQAPYSNCIAQPDPGSQPQNNYFAFGGSNGFFTGPMTEILGGNVSSCETLGSMPMVTYRFANGAYITQASPWSDEWNPGQSLMCYSTVPSTAWDFSANDASNYITDSSGSSSYGPHWENLANISASSIATWWEFDTDATLATPVANHASMDVGQFSSVSFEDNFAPRSLTGGSTFIGWTWTSPISGCTQPPSDPQTLNCGAPSASGVGIVTFNVSEWNGYNLVGPPLAFTVYPTPSVDSIALAPGEIDLGQAIDLSLAISGGSGGLTAQWTNLPAGCVGGGSTAFVCSPTAAGTFDLSAEVTDANGVTSNSASATLRVLNDPTVAPITIGPVSGKLDAGQTLTLTATPTGGTSVFTYSWQGLPNGCLSSNDSVISCTPSSNGAFEVQTQVTDSTGFAVSSPSLVVEVFADPALRASESQASLVQGQSLDLTINVTGGLAPYATAWTGLPEGCVSTDSLVIACTPTSTGPTTIWVHVTDAAGFVVSTAINLTVSPSFFGTSLSPTVGWSLVVIVVLAAVSGAALVLVRKRRSRSGPPSSMPARQTRPGRQ